ncbi:HTH-type transcriptional activator RhaS [Paenibacillus sp. JJ-100]|uniref:AraC family transcriptional regulator n=1 Tax=Paenibacillus sp. JJ-100 TaxID=2974896 RepID=UPI0022FF77D8|nr:AraC family transcriptional regulator [Paenibacillus sp. JJ-100]CAI6081667.1 HTH-type transcriptional activator RhaS [Paenibacillus sp. JJ-100]
MITKRNIGLSRIPSDDKLPERPYGDFNKSQPIETISEKSNPSLMSEHAQPASNPNEGPVSERLMVRDELHQFLTDTLIELRQAEYINIINTDRPFQWKSDELLHHTFIYMHRFSGTQMVDGEQARIARKAACLYPPGTQLELVSDADQDTELYILEFDLFRVTEKTALRRIYERELGSPVTGWIQGPFYGIQRIASQLTELADQGYEAASRAIKAQLLLTDLLHMLWPEDNPWPAEEKAQNDPEFWLKSTLQYIQQHYMHEIKLDTLAELAGMHPSYYSQLFKSRMQKNPTEYITHLRMNRAKEMLLTSDLRIRDIAREVGYRDEFYFSRRFRNHAGYAPTAYPKQVHRNIVSLSYPYTDHLMTLGITPCAAQIQGQLPHLPQSLKLPFHAYEPWEQGRQAFLDVSPELILTKDNAAVKAMEHIGDIAPIITIPWNQTDVFGHLKRIASIVDRTKAANEWLERHERKAERARKKIKEAAGGLTVAVGTLTAKGTRMYSHRNFGHVFYRTLQLAAPQRIQAELQGKTPGVGFNWMPFTPGEWDGLEADVLVLAIDNMHNRTALLQKLMNDPQWNSHPAVRHGRLHLVDWNSWVVYAPYSINIQLDEALSLLTNQPALL